MPSQHVWAYGWHFWGTQLVRTVLAENLICLQLLTCLLHPLYALSPTPYNMPSVILQWFWKKFLKIQQCKPASRNSYKMLPKRLFQLYSISGIAIQYIWLQSSTSELQWHKYLKLVFLRIPNVTTWSVFQNTVTYTQLSQHCIRKLIHCNSHQKQLYFNNKMEPFSDKGGCGVYSRTDIKAFRRTGLVFS